MDTHHINVTLLGGLLIVVMTIASDLAAVSSQQCTTYTVKSGDTCYAIAQANGVSLSDFEGWNSDIDCANLQIGSQVCVSAPSSSSSPPPASSPAGNGKVFREYIGALFNGVTLSDLAPAINADVEVHVILAFAIDYTSDGSASTNGQFNVFWDQARIGADAVKAFKAQHSNVKVMVSLGGDSVSGNPAQFKAASVDSWVSNAVSSLTSLVQTYGLDGIDVDYEHFDQTSNADFASAVGQLISQLKQQGVISVASIAPFDGVQSPYSALWAQYSSVIDYVNFQFYTYSSSTTAADYVSHYNAASSTYAGGKVLASFTTDSSASTNSVSPDVALEACRQLQASNSLPGIFIWCADTSYASSSSFQYEQSSQALLAGASS